jgi:UDP-N-acetylmuramate dehydrogenase
MTALALDLLEREKLAPYTSVQLGGPAEFLSRASSLDAISLALDWASRRGLAVTLLGGGSNVVIADAGVPGLVLTVALRGRSIIRHAGQVDVTVRAGERWDDFVAACVDQGWAGVECLSGIPGHVGATPIQNVGAYGQEVSDCLLRVEVYDRTLNRAVELEHGQCGFDYRTSRFKTTDGERFIVLGATFRLREGGRPCLSYPEIARRFTPGQPPSLRSVRDAVLATRRSKSMLLEPGENARSCGSFFLNPRLTSAELDRLRERSATVPPSFPQPDGRIKVPAAWLIEQAGFARGQRWGSVGLSSQHALALVCHDGATAAALLDAARRVRDGVARAFEIGLFPEPRFLGFELGGDGFPRAG